LRFRYLLHQREQATVWNNTIDSVAHSGIEAVSSGAIEAINNTITDCFTGVWAWDSPVVMDYNNLYHNAFGQDYSGVKAAPHDMHVPPDLVDPASLDLHLLPSSPLVDAGDPAFPTWNEPGQSAGRIDIEAFGNTNETTEQ